MKPPSGPQTKSHRLIAVLQKLCLVNSESYTMVQKKISELTSTAADDNLDAIASVLERRPSTALEVTIDQLGEHSAWIASLWSTILLSNMLDQDMKNSFITHIFRARLDEYLELCKKCSERCAEGDAILKLLQNLYAASEKLPTDSVDTGKIRAAIKIISEKINKNVLEKSSNMLAQLLKINNSDTLKNAASEEIKSNNKAALVFQNIIAVYKQNPYSFNTTNATSTSNTVTAVVKRVVLLHRPDWIITLYGLIQKNDLKKNTKDAFMSQLFYPCLDEYLKILIKNTVEYPILETQVKAAQSHIESLLEITASDLISKKKLEDAKKNIEKVSQYIEKTKTTNKKNFEIQHATIARKALLNLKFEKESCDNEILEILQKTVDIYLINSRIVLKNAIQNYCFTTDIFHAILNSATKFLQSINNSEEEKKHAAMLCLLAKSDEDYPRILSILALMQNPTSRHAKINIIRDHINTVKHKDYYKDSLLALLEQYNTANQEAFITDLQNINNLEDIQKLNAACDDYATWSLSLEELKKQWHFLPLPLPRALLEVEPAQSEMEAWICIEYSDNSQKIIPHTELRGQLYGVSPGKYALLERRKPDGPTYRAPSPTLEKQFITTLQYVAQEKIKKKYWYHLENRGDWQSIKTILRILADPKLTDYTLFKEKLEQVQVANDEKIKNALGDVARRVHIPLFKQAFHEALEAISANPEKILENIKCFLRNAEQDPCLQILKNTDVEYQAACNILMALNENDGKKLQHPYYTDDLAERCKKDITANPELKKRMLPLFTIYKPYLQNAYITAFIAEVDKLREINRSAIDQLKDTSAFLLIKESPDVEQVIKGLEALASRQPALAQNAHAAISPEHKNTLGKALLTHITQHQQLNAKPTALYLFPQQPELSQANSPLYTGAALLAGGPDGDSSQRDELPKLTTSSCSTADTQPSKLTVGALLSLINGSGCKRKLSFFFFSITLWGKPETVNKILAIISNWTEQEQCNDLTVLCDPEKVKVLHEVVIAGLQREYGFFDPRKRAKKTTRLYNDLQQRLKQALVV